MRSTGTSYGCCEGRKKRLKHILDTEGTDNEKALLKFIDIFRTTMTRTLA